MQKIDAQKSLPELVYDAVLNAVCEGTLRPGERVTQEALAQRLNVSRLPVGQALRQLEGEGFLCPSGRRGLRVSPLTPELVRDLYGLRAGMDMIAAGLAAHRAGRAFARRGRRILDDGRSAMMAGDLPLLISADWEFHWLVYETADNDQILEVMASKWHHVRRVMNSVIDDVENQALVWSQHERIFQAVRAGEVVRAERISREHVESASRWLQEAAAMAQRRSAG